MSDTEQKLNEAKDQAQELISKIIEKGGQVAKEIAEVISAQVVVGMSDHDRGVAGLKRWADRVFEDNPIDGATEIEIHKEVTIIGVDSFLTRFGGRREIMDEGILHSVILDRMGPIEGDQPTAFKVEASGDEVERIREDCRIGRKGRLVLHLEPIE